MYSGQHLGADVIGESTYTAGGCQLCQAGRTVGVFKQEPLPTAGWQSNTRFSKWASHSRFSNIWFSLHLGNKIERGRQGVGTNMPTVNRAIDHFWQLLGHMWPTTLHTSYYSVANKWNAYRSTSLLVLLVHSEQTEMWISRIGLNHLLWYTSICILKSKLHITNK